MNTYRCSNGGSYHEDIIAETASKARYKYYLRMEDNEPYSEWFRHIKSKKIGCFKVSHLFGDQQRFDYTCKYRGIEFAYIGMRCEVNGRKGTITGASTSCNLDVCYDGDSYSFNSHPYSKFLYFDKDGKLIAIDGKLIEANHD